MATKTSMLAKHESPTNILSNKKKKELDIKMNSKSHLSSNLMLVSQFVGAGRFNEGLPSFLTKGLVTEQIWQQLELRLDHKLALPVLMKEVLQITAQKNRKRKKLNKSKAAEAKLTNGSGESELDTSGEEEEEEQILKSIKKRLAADSGDSKAGDGDLFGDESSDEDLELALDNALATGLSEDDEEEEDDAGSDKNKINRPAKKRKTVVDDAFFKMADMEEFLDSEDLKEEKKRKRDQKKKDDGAKDEEEDDDEDNINMFSDLDSEGDADPVYADFFDPPKGGVKSHKSLDMDDDSDSDNSDIPRDETMLPSGSEEGMDSEDEKENQSESDDNALKKVSFANDLFQSDEETVKEEKVKEKKLSSYEAKQQQLMAKAREMEEQSLKEVSWELLGEAVASKRPENSLLETVLDFQHTTRAAPVITEETTKTLEDYIKQRIKDKTFDDVERKEKKKEEVFEFKKRIVLDQEKSKMSLGELYEQEFMKQQQKDTSEVKADPECESIEKELNKLFHQLDALSNFRYTPMKPGTEVKIIVNTPAITMEEVAPVATADADLLAPEEVHEKVKGDLKAAEERTITDKKRDRRQKKQEKRERKKAKEARQKLVEKLKPGLGNKYSKEKALKQLEQLSKEGGNVMLIKGDKKKLSSSTAFFKELQEETQTKASLKKKQEKKNTITAAKVML